MSIKVLIIDDDRFEMEEFIDSIVWSDMGFEIVGTAVDGLQGYSLYQKEKPDLIITDIQMPGLSGIELTEKIREEDSEVRIMFLSSYGTFEYAQSGFQLEISGYILKQQINVQDTITKLLSIKDEILRIKKYSKETVEDILNKAIQISDLTSNDISVLGEKKFNIYALFEQKPIKFYQDMSSYDSSINYLSVRKVFQGNQNMFVVPYSSDCILIFIEANRYTALNNFKALDLLDALTTSFNTSFVIFSLDELLNIHEVNQAIKQIADIFEAHIFIKKNTIVPLKTISIEYNNTKFDLEKLNLLENTCNYIKMHKYLDEVFMRIFDSYDYKSFYNCKHMLLQRLNHKFGKILNLKEDSDKFLQHNLVFSPADAVIMLIKELYKKCFECLDKSQTFSVYIEEAINYILNNYTNADINIELIANHVSLSTTRLSAIFKKRSGKTIHQFLTDLRIAKVKQLLLDGKRRKLDSIAKEVGYLNGRYLSRVFKKEVGISPEDFKKRRYYD